MGTPPTKDGPELDVGEPAIERLFAGAADPAEPQPSSGPTGGTVAGPTQEDSDA